MIYESYVGWDKQLYNHNSDDGETKERSASPSVWARHSSSITQPAGRMSDIVLLVWQTRADWPQNSSAENWNRYHFIRISEESVPILCI